MKLTSQVVQLATTAYKKIPDIKAKLLPIFLATTMVVFFENAAGSVGLAKSTFGLTDHNLTLKPSASSTASARSVDLSEESLAQLVSGLTVKFYELYKITVNSEINGDTHIALKLYMGDMTRYGLRAITLKNGFVITKDGHLKGKVATSGGSNTAGLFIADTAVINGEITNAGKITGGVVIGAAAKVFPLRSSGDSFTNKGEVTGGFTIGGVIGAEKSGIAANTTLKDAKAVDTFKLKNISGATITGDIKLVATSNIKFDLTNDGCIKAPANTITATTIENKANATIHAKFANATSAITNSGIICLPVSGGASAMAVTSYKGEDGSELHLNFSNAITQVNNGIVAVTEATFTKGSKLVLCGDAGIIVNKKTTAVNLVKATTKITIDGSLTDLLYVEKFEGKDNNDYIVLPTDASLLLIMQQLQLL